MSVLCTQRLSQNSEPALSCLLKQTYKFYQACPIDDCPKQDF